MVKLSQVQASNAQVSESDHVKTAVFVGATSGVGRAALTELVAASEKRHGLRIYVVGRSNTAAATTAHLDTLRQKGTVELVYLEGDVSLLADAKRLCDELKKRESSLDLLYLSAGYVPFSGRVDTAEGLDVSHALGHYSRMLFMMQLLPLLKCSKYGRVVSVFAGGMETANIDLEDINLDKPGNFGAIKSQRQMAVMHSVCMEQLAEENPAVTFIHAYPGAINTGNLLRGWGDRWIMRGIIAAVTAPLFSVLGFSLKESGERITYILTSARFGGKGVPLSDIPPGHTSRGEETGGLFLVNQHCDTVVKPDIMDQLRRDARPKMWAKVQEILGSFM